jgi:hypothetical protein
MHDGAVMVAFGARRIQIPEAQYRANGYKPALEKLGAQKGLTPAPVGKGPTANNDVRQDTRPRTAQEHSQRRATRGSIDNSSSECAGHHAKKAGHHAKKESAGKGEKEECAHVVLPTIEAT